MNTPAEDEETRARITLLEYGSRGLFVPNPGATTPTKKNDLMIEDDGPSNNEVCHFHGYYYCFFKKNILLFCCCTK